MHIHLSKIAWIGVIIVISPICVFGCWYTWLQTRSTRPVYVPVSLAPGEIKTDDFKTNLSGQYTLTIEGKKTMPFDTLNCLLGVSMLPEKCDRVSVLKADWTLTDRGKAIQKGRSDTDDGGSWAQDTIERELATFWLQRGHAYTIRVQFLDDGRAIAPTDPHLKIEIHPGFYEGTMFFGYFLLTWCKRVMIAGGSILALSGVMWTWKKMSDRRTQSNVVGG